MLGLFYKIYIEFLTYINAENGKEEDTLILINTENGTLTE